MFYSSHTASASPSDLTYSTSKLTSIVNMIYHFYGKGNPG